MEVMLGLFMELLLVEGSYGGGIGAIYGAAIS